MDSTNDWNDKYFRAEKYFLLWLAKQAMYENELNSDQKDFATDMGLVTLIILSEWLQIDTDDNTAFIKARQYFIEQRFKYATDVIVEYGGYKKRIFTTKGLDCKKKM